MKIKLTYAPAINAIVLTFPYDPELTQKAKDIGGRAVYKDKKFIRWQIEFTPEAESLILDHKDDPAYEIAESVYFAFETAREIKAKNYELSISDSADIKVNAFLDPVLKGYQKAGVEYICNNSSGVLLADEMGLGKTLQALASIERMSYYPALILCPAVVKYNWLRECEKWLTHRRAALVESYKDDVKGTGPAEIYIINYDILQKYWGLLDSGIWQVLICDESHFLKNHKADRTIRVQKLAEGIPHKILMTGTPVLNRPKELLSQLMILGKLDSIGGFWHFVETYCQKKDTNFGMDINGAANLEDLNKRMRESCYVRREKKEVLKELPPKNRIPQWVKIDNGPEYEEAESDVIEYLKENARVEAEFIESIKDRPEAEQASLIAEYRESVARRAARAEAIVKINVLKQIVARGKLKAAQAWIKNYFEESDSKLVIFAWHTETIAALCKEFECESITGDTSPEDRDRIVHDFQNKKDCKMLVCNIQAGGVGITLTAANTSLFLELGWNPGTMDQAEDRIHRMGQMDSATIFYMLGEGTIDRENWEMIEYKRRVVGDASDGFIQVREWMINRSRK